MPIRIALFLLLTPWFFGTPLGARPQVSMDDPAWNLESDRQGVKIYSCKVPGTGIVPCKAELFIPGSVAEISCVLEDAARRGEWISHFGGSSLLERLSDYNQIEYLRVAMPWPIVDRSSIVKVEITVSDDQGTAVVTARSVSRPLKTGLPRLVEAEIHESTFQMQTVQGGTLVTALVFIDPKGALPKWVVNLFTGGVSRQTLTGLRRQVAKKLYTPGQVAAMQERILDYRTLQP